MIRKIFNLLAIGGPTNTATELWQPVPLPADRLFALYNRNIRQNQLQAERMR